MNRLAHCLVLILLLIAFHTGVSAQSLAIYTEASPPGQIQGANGEPAGPSVEVVREIQKRVGNTDPIQIVPWARGYMMLENNPNTALFVVGRTAERNQLFQWVGPIVEVTYSFYVKADSKLVIRSMEDAKKLKAIGVYRDDVRDQLLTKTGFTNLERTTDNVLNVKKLMAGRIDAITSSSLAVGSMIESAGFKREDLRDVFPLLRVQLWIAFSKGTPETTVSAWAKTFEAIKKDKTFEKIMKTGWPAWTPPGKPITSF